MQCDWLRLSDHELIKAEAERDGVVIKGVLIGAGTVIYFPSAATTSAALSALFIELQRLLQLRRVVGETLSGRCDPLSEYQLPMHKQCAVVFRTR